MTQNVAFIAAEDGLSVFVDARQYVVNSTHPHFAEILAKLNDEDYAGLVPLMDAQVGLRTAFDATDKLQREGFTVQGTLIAYEGEAFSEIVSEKVLRTAAAGLPIGPVCRFLVKLRQNPSFTAQKELLLFCEANRFQIHVDGDIIAYKGVRDDYLDIYSATISNRVGAVVAMPRNQVNDNRSETCSRGLHFAADRYAQSWSGEIGRVMVMKINPRDVVSIPSDYQNEKGRCCRYEVIAELPAKAAPAPREVYTDRDLGVPETTEPTLEDQIAARARAVFATANIVIGEEELYTEFDELDITRTQRTALANAMRDEFGDEVEGYYTFPQSFNSFDSFGEIVEDLVLAVEEARANVEDLDDDDEFYEEDDDEEDWDL